MPGRLSILPTLAAMMMVLFTTMVPHHHHQAMICLVKEVCEIDGCTDDEHTSHSDANHEEDENHCVSHEKYSPSDNLRLDFTPFITGEITAAEPSGMAPVAARTSSRRNSTQHLSPPPLLTWRINC